MSKRENTARMKMISSRAKQIYAKGNMKWTSAISLAAKQLKKEGKL